MYPIDNHDSDGEPQTYPLSTLQILREATNEKGVKATKGHSDDYKPLRALVRQMSSQGVIDSSDYKDDEGGRDLGYSAVRGGSSTTSASVELTRDGIIKTLEYFDKVNATDSDLPLEDPTVN